MGQLLKATCSCGYQSDQLMQGLGFNFINDGSYYEICYCDNCGIVEDREKRSTPICNICQKQMTFYRKGAVKDQAADKWDMQEDENDYWEQKQHWYCPACKQDLLSFQFFGLWD